MSAAEQIEIIKVQRQLDSLIQKIENTNQILEEITKIIKLLIKLEEIENV